ncbi:conserved domain protein [Peptoniphilus sp. oral taxon 375 str. F0436]|nr:conserved domain protein [Peptoniphilus sp. oral taxon 375 str. F0436]
MSKRAKRTLKVGFRWMILGAIAWSLIIVLAGAIADIVTGSAVDQVDSYNRAVHAELPETAYEAYRQ